MPERPRTIATLSHTIFAYSRLFNYFCIKMSQKHIYTCISALISIGLGIMILLVPTYGDDSWYLANSTGTPGSWEYFITTWQNCLDHLTFDTGRLANLTSCLFLALFPRWVFALLSTAAVWLILSLGQKIARFAPAGSGAALWLLTIVFLYPWLDHLFTIIYALNYLWATAVGIAYTYLFIKCEQGEISWRAMPWLVMLGIATGWWHEGLSVPMAAGLTTYLLLRLPTKPKPESMAMYVALIAGIIVIICTPAFSNQTHIRHSNLIKTVWWETAVNALAFNFITYIYLAAYIIIISSRKLRARLNLRHNEIAIVSGAAIFGVVSTMLYFKYYNGPRMGTFSLIASALTLIWLATRAKPRINHPMAIYIIATILSAASITTAVLQQQKITDEYHTVLAMSRKNPHHEAYFNQTPVTISIDLLKPTYFLLNTKFGLEQDQIVLLPAELKGFSPQSPSTTFHPNKLMLYNNCVVKDTTDANKRIDLIITDIHGHSHHTRTRSYQFHGSDGKTYIYLAPHSRTLGNNTPIKEVRIAEY